MTLGEKLENKSNSDQMYKCTVCNCVGNNCRERNCRNKLNANDLFPSKMKHQGLYTCIHVANIAKIANAVQVSLRLSVTKGQIALPNQMYFRKTSKRPLIPSAVVQTFIFNQRHKEALKNFGKICKKKIV